MKGTHISLTFPMQTNNCLIRHLFIQVLLYCFMGDQNSHIVLVVEIVVSLVQKSVSNPKLWCISLKKDYLSGYNYII